MLNDITSLRLELVVPAFNESRSLEPLIERYRVAAVKAGFTPEEFQLVVVNNGSTDESAATLASLEIARVGPWFRTVNIEKNVGYGHGIFTGLSQTRAPVIGYSHADEQCAPEDVFRAFAVLQGSGASVSLVKGSRQGRSFRDVFVTRVFEFLARIIIGFRVNEINAQPKVFPRRLLESLTNPPTNFAFDLYVLYQAQKAKYRIESIPVDFPGRRHGVSRWAATFASRYKTILGQIRYMIQLVSSEGRLEG